MTSSSFWHRYAHYSSLYKWKQNRTCTSTSLFKLYKTLLLLFKTHFLLLCFSYVDLICFFFFLNTYTRTTTTNNPINTNCCITKTKLRHFLINHRRLRCRQYTSYAKLFATTFHKEKTFFAPEFHCFLIRNDINYIFLIKLQRFRHFLL